jgi:DNA topoisomerase-1
MRIIEQFRQTGIHRLGTKKRGFKYRSAANRRVSAEALQRIQQLKIPPAWNDVWINPAPGGAVQAIGRDAAERWQYLYHADHVRRRKARKFRRLVKFAQALPKMRRMVAAHIRLPGFGKEPVMASILRTLSRCFLRPGSENYASENGSFGLATLRPRHLKVKGSLVEFEFTGKSGVHQQSRIKDRHVARIVRGLLRHPSRQVFKFQNGEGVFVKVTRHHINEYIRDIMGENFSAKDFRTWAGTLVCACALAKLGTTVDESIAARKQKVVAAVKETAQILGNTPAVCRSSYVCPEIIDGFVRGKVIRRFFKTPDELIRYRGWRLHAAERSLLAFMKQPQRVNS